MRRRILQIAIIVILLLFLIGTARQVIKLNSAKSKIGKAEQKLENLKTENEKLRQEIDFRQTQGFIEEAARNQLGLAKEGETVVILPKVEGVRKEEVKKESGIKFWFDRLFGS